MDSSSEPSIIEQSGPSSSRAIHNTVQTRSNGKFKSKSKTSYKTDKEDYKFECDLIEYIRNNPALHDCGHPDYKNTTYKNKLWQDFASIHDVTEEDVRSKWGSLRTGFRNALSRLNSATCRGIRWHHLDRMMFIDTTRASNGPRYNPNHSAYNNGSYPNNNPNYFSNQLASNNDSVEHVNKISIQPQVMMKENEDDDDMTDDDGDNSVYSSIVSNKSIDKPTKRAVNESNGNASTASNKRKSSRDDSMTKLSQSALLNEIRKIKNQKSNEELVVMKQILDDNNDPVMLFLKSLIPDLKTLNEKQFRKFRRRTLEIIDDIHDEA